MLSLIEKLFFIVLLIVSVVLSYRTFSAMVRVINKGQGKLHFDNLFRRITTALSVFISQKTVLVNRPIISFLHALVAWAFILYFLVNLGDVLTAFIPDFHFLGRGIVGNLYRLFVDIFSVLAMISVLFFLVRRFILKSERLKISENVLLNSSTRKGIARDSLIVGLFIFFHVGFRFLGESFIIASQSSDVWQPLASGFALVWAGLQADSLIIFYHACWWLALGLILAFIPYFPFSKHAHLFMGPFNYLSKPERSAPGTMEKLNFEDEKIEQFGVAKLEHLDKPQIVDAFACIMCNRCQDVCPASFTGKELSPSALEINKRYFINTNMLSGKNSSEEQPELLQYALSESALWACTSCAACVEICPVGNEPMYDILNIRRDRVLMQSKFPNQLQNAFNGMERNGNPWNMNKDRLEWVQEDPGLVVKTVQDNPDFDILYWVGCAGAFDQRGQKVARSFAKILNKAGVNFSVLGDKEKCTGDSARRTGNEYIFSMLAEENVNNLKSAKVKKIVTTCPHCLHTLKNEYPQFDGNFEVVHHAQFIEELINSGKISFKNGNKDKITYHDPCYLGRHNGIYQSPRSALSLSGADLIEMDRNRNRSFCCGAGGGNMWKEEEEGKEAVRRERLREAELTDASVVATGCPFCMTMLCDAGNEIDSKMKITDIAELIADKIEG